MIYVEVNLPEYKALMNNGKFYKEEKKIRNWSTGVDNFKMLKRKFQTGRGFLIIHDNICVFSCFREFVQRRGSCFKNM